MRKVKGGSGDACPTTLAALYVPIGCGWMKRAILFQNS